MIIPIAFIRSAARSERFRISYHALQRMNERGISYAQVRDAMLAGDVVEVQRHPPPDDVKVLLQEDCDGIPRLYVVVAACDPPEVVTVCEFLEEVWEYLGSMRRRRKRYE